MLVCYGMLLYGVMWLVAAYTIVSGIVFSVGQIPVYGASCVKV